MKKAISTFCFAVFGTFLFAQSNYEKILNEKAEKITIAKTQTDYDQLFIEFSKLKNTPNPYQWKAYYYAGLVLYKKGELILHHHQKSNIAYVNSLAEKYILGSLTAEPNDKESHNVLNLIREQKMKFDDSKAISDHKE